MDYDTWRRQARLMRAVELLVAGSSSKATAHAVGYNQPSTFTATFARHFGSTPKIWLAMHSSRKS